MASYFVARATDKTEEPYLGAIGVQIQWRAHARRPTHRILQLEFSDGRRIWIDRENLEPVAEEVTACEN